MELGGGLRYRFDDKGWYEVAMILLPLHSYYMTKNEELHHLHLKCFHASFRTELGEGK